MILPDEPSLGLSPKLVKEIFRSSSESTARTGPRSSWSSRMPTLRCRLRYLLRLHPEPRTHRHGGYGGGLAAEGRCQEFYLGIGDKGCEGVRRWKKREDMAMTIALTRKRHPGGWDD